MQTSALKSNVTQSWRRNLASCPRNAAPLWLGWSSLGLTGGPRLGRDRAEPIFVPRSPLVRYPVLTWSRTWFTVSTSSYFECGRLKASRCTLEEPWPGREGSGSLLRCDYNPFSSSLKDALHVSLPGYVKTKQTNQWCSRVLTKKKMSICRNKVYSTGSTNLLR